jgi:hypothetical protein
MAIDTTKNEYDLYLPMWRKCRDVVGGQEHMHLAGTTYIPKLSGQNDYEYNAYVSRALFYNATSRTIDAMSGLMFRKEPMLSIPTAIEFYLEDVDLNGNDIHNFLDMLVTEILTVGRLGVLVEHPEVVIDDVNSFTKAQLEQENIRPFFATYKAEAILNWKIKRIRNQFILTQIVLCEECEEHKGEFETSCYDQYRVIDLDPATGDYRQRLFIKNNDKTFKQIGEDNYPLKSGQRMKYIPFVFFNAKGNLPSVEKPPLLDLVNVNVSHYRTTADLEHGEHFTGLPTVVVTGHSRDDKSSPLKIGSTTAWVFSEADADAKYLEFTGSGLETLQKSLDRKEHQMATLGARMLATEKAAAETEESHKIKRQGENSALAGIARSVDSGMKQLFRIMCDWLNLDDSAVDFSINKDFISSKMTSQELLALFQVHQGGGMAFSDFIENLKRGEIIDAEKTPEDIKAELELEGPRGGVLNG